MVSSLSRLRPLGKQEPFRSEINSEESPIESLKVSHSKCVSPFACLLLYETILSLPFRNYLIVLFRDQPFELWDLRTFNLIRRLPKKCPRILALVRDALPHDLAL